MPVPPRVPVVTFYDPNKSDRGLIEIWSTTDGPYEPLDLYTPHPNTRDYAGFKLGIQVAIDADQKWIKRVWVSDETNPDWFNYQIKYAAEADAYPTFIRQYRIEKKHYSPLPKGTPLGAIYKLVMTDPGSGFTVGSFPPITFPWGQAVGHGIVNQDGTIAEFVLDYGYGYSSDYGVEIDASYGISAAYGTAYVQPQTAVLTSEQAEEYPQDSEFFGIYFKVTRVYETLPGPTLQSSKLDDKDGAVMTISTTRKLCSDISTEEDVTTGIWTRTTKKETEIQGVCEEVVTQRTVPGIPMVDTKLDDDGVVVTTTQTYTESSLIVSSEALVTGVWTRKYGENIDGSSLVSWQFVVSRTIPGPLQHGEETGKWGLEPITRQKIALPGAPDEGYFVRESKVEPEQGSTLVGNKTTVFYASNVYGVNLQGQDYDPRLDAVIPYITQIRPQSYGIGVNREDITPIDYQHADVRTIDPTIVQAVLDAYVFSYPGRINVDMPDLLTAVYGVMTSATSSGADQETGAYSLSGSGGVSQALTADSQASANILPEAYPVIRQFWGNNIACSHYHFFLPNPVTLSDVLTKLNGILGVSVSNWPKFNPQVETLVITGGRVSIQAKAKSQGSYSTSGSGTSSTTAGGVGYSQETGLIVKTLRISPTIHDVINVIGGTYGTQSVMATAYAEAAGLGPLETQTTGPFTVYGQISPTTIPATIGQASWPSSGKYLYRTDPHPYRYGYIEFHCVIVDAADFPNV